MEDGSSVSKGVEVLSAVSKAIDCGFFHLLENAALDCAIEVPWRRYVLAKKAAAGHRGRLLVSVLEERESKLAYTAARSPAEDSLSFN